MQVDTYAFRLVLLDTDAILRDESQDLLLQLADAVFTAGCDDGHCGATGKEVFIDVDRVAASLRDTIQSAVSQVRQAGYRVARVEPIGREVFEEINATL